MPQCLKMWGNICMGNRQALLAQMGAYQRELEALREILVKHDGKALEQAFSQAMIELNYGIRRLHEIIGRIMSYILR